MCKFKVSSGGVGFTLQLLRSFTCVLQVRSPNLDDVMETLCFFIQSIAQERHGGDERLLNFYNSSNMHWSRETMGKVRDNDHEKSTLQNKVHWCTYVSLEDWLILTWSFGWITSLPPSFPPRIWIALFAITLKIVMSDEGHEEGYEETVSTCLC